MMRDIVNESRYTSSEYSDFFDCSYGELIGSMEVEVLVEVSDNSYQGDTRILLRNGSQYGILLYGWGS
jgi:hypothetical protein